jgi:hypothetical protein
MVPDISRYFSKSLVLAYWNSVPQTRIIRADEWNSTEACAMSSAKEFEIYARDCVNLAEQPDAPPELREQLFQMAREWMQAMMEAEDDRRT